MSTVCGHILLKHKMSNLNKLLNNFSKLTNKRNHKQTRMQFSCCLINLHAKAQQQIHNKNI